MTLQRARRVTASQDIRRRIERRLDAWEAGRYKILVEDTLRSPTEYFTAVRREETAEHRAKTFHGLVLRGKLRTAVRWMTEREKGGVLQPEGHCTKTGDRLLEVLHAKHPDARPPLAACLDAYPGKPPEMVPVDITDDVALAVAGRLTGGVGPGGTYSMSLQHWLLQFGTASRALRLIVEEMGE